MRNEKGFTLVELMIVVAIIGTLSAIAYPNFKKYQARQRTLEAKLQLSNLYTAESNFLSDFGMYANCLRYMGYDPSPDQAQRFYTVGINVDIAPIDATAYAAATNVGLNAASCPQTGGHVPGDGNTDPRASVYFAGKGMGNIKTDASFNFTGSPAQTSPGVCSNITNVSGHGQCLGSQAATSLTFQAVATGVIDSDNVTGARVSLYNIDSNKVLREIVPGY